MASSNHRAITAEPVNHIFTSRQCPFVLVVWLFEKEKPYTF